MAVSKGVKKFVAREFLVLLILGVIMGLAYITIEFVAEYQAKKFNTCVEQVNTKQILLRNLQTRACKDGLVFYDNSESEKRTAIQYGLGLSIALLYLTRVVFCTFKGFYLMVRWAIKTVKE